MFAPLIDYITKRSSSWFAKNGAAFVTLVDPATGLPYVASGGGGGGGTSLVGTAGTDSNGTSWLMVLNTSVSPATATFYNPQTGATGTPVGTFVPNRQAEDALPVNVIYMAHSQVFEVINGFGSTVPVVAGDVVIKKTSTLTGVLIDWYKEDGVTVIDGSPASPNDVDDLIGAPVLSAYTETRVLNGVPQTRTDTYKQTANALRSFAPPISVGAWV